MSLGDIMAVSQERGLKEWEPGAKRILQFVSHQILACLVTLLNVHRNIKVCHVCRILFCHAIFAHVRFSLCQTIALYH